MPKRKERLLPKVGVIFLRKYLGKRYELEVVEKNGSIAYKLDEIIYKTPSAAAKSIVKYEVDGPRFWKMDK